MSLTVGNGDEASEAGVAQNVSGVAYAAGGTCLLGTVWDGREALGAIVSEDEGGSTVLADLINLGGAILDLGITGQGAVGGQDEAILTGLAYFVDLDDAVDDLRVAHRRV